jgi:hypothetical protein
MTDCRLANCTADSDQIPVDPTDDVVEVVMPRMVDMNVKERKQTDDTLDELIANMYLGSAPFSKARTLLECHLIIEGMLLLRNPSSEPWWNAGVQLT